jgi:hypothetical protein
MSDAGLFNLDTPDEVMYRVSALTMETRVAFLECLRPNMRMQSDAAARRQDRGDFESWIWLDSSPNLLGRRG